MKSKDIYKIAVAFRAAIVSAKYDRRFHYRDRMRNFPGGCCDDSCDLLAYYLYTTYKIRTRQGIGTYRDNDPNNTTDHAWLIMYDNTIIDITGDQFRYCAGYTDEVYVGVETLFYKKLERKQVRDNYDITKDARLLDDYQIIMSYMS